MNPTLPVGKLPPEFLSRLLAKAQSSDKRIILGPGIGLDCAVLDFEDHLLVVKSDPITFTTDDIGWYAVQINSNDIATTGGVPLWMLVTLLLPEGRSTPDLVEYIFNQVYDACLEKGISVVGGHTEITYGIERPILVGTMIGETTRQQLITPRGAQPGDHVLLTKGIPIEATAILAREFPDRIEKLITAEELRMAKYFIHDPGLSILPDAQIAIHAGRVNAMHDPTEGGLAAALWELAQASGRKLMVYPARVPIPRLSSKICGIFGIDPMRAIASGALLLTCPPGEIVRIQQAMVDKGIICTDIGEVRRGEPSVWQPSRDEWELLPEPERDEIARLFE